MTRSTFLRYMRQAAHALVIIGLCTAGSHALAQSGWTSVQTSTHFLLHGIDFPTPTLGIAVGDSGAIVKTTDGGITWTDASSGTQANLWSVRCWSPTFGIACGDGGVILRTTDGGTTWAPQTSGLKDGILPSFLFGLFSRDNGQTIYATGGDGEAISGVVLKSTDAGITWKKTDVAGTFFIDRCAFIDAINGFAVGASGPTGGTILRTTDAGATWAEVHPAASLISAIAAPIPMNIVAVGVGGVVYSSTDGGTTWTEKQSPTTDALLAISFRTATEGIAVGDAGAVITTNDGGATWQDQSLSNTGTLSDVAIAPGTGVAYAAGDGGIVHIRAATNGVHSQRDSQAPQAWLSPNPVTTSATLRVAPRAAVAVYDMLGRRLIHRQLEAGESIAIDRDAFAAGRYVYTIAPDAGPPTSGTFIVR